VKHSFLFLAASALIATACSHSSHMREPNSAPNPALFPGEVWGPSEDAIAERITQSSIETAKKNQSDGIMRRDAHPKHHGCVRATWVTANDLEVGREAGIFSEPGKSFDAWIRFSNGSPGGAHAPDSEKDVRGMAVKLMNVKGTPQGSQDFVMMTSKRFFSKDADDYMKLHEALNGGKAATLAYLAMNPRNALIINGAQIKAENPLSTTFTSPVPSRLGDSSMRFKAVPCGTIPKAKVEKDNPNFLREALVDTLGKQDACFNFYVEPNENPERNPIEDPRLAWDEEESPFLFAARLTIPKQSDITSPEQLAFCENISFNPWNTQDEIRPLGQINRIRKLVYDNVSKFRHDENHVTAAEPVNHAPCSTPATASLCAAKH
jgi:hypothetical protein